LSKRGRVFAVRAIEEHWAVNFLCVKMDYSIFSSWSSWESGVQVLFSEGDICCSVAFVAYRGCMIHVLGLMSF
jgi:hypothetical protein